jgi:diketogulonate reductase-like aldo/keto reductase
MNRRTMLRNLAGLSTLPLLPHFTLMDRTIAKRKIPSSGEWLPVIGLGTWQTFDVGNSSDETTPLTDVLKTLVDQGGTVVDSSPMYGRSESVVGALSTKANLNSKLFMATKVWTTGKESGIKQMKESFRLLQRPVIDLMQIHNLTDWKTHLSTLRHWKEEGLIRYIGITHYTEGAYGRVEEIMRKEKIDFLQINYSIRSRKAEDTLFPLASDKGVAVLINRPFEEGSLFQLVKGKDLPAWAGEFDCNSWGQFFLKFIISHPSVNCAIPGTSKPRHMLDNIMAGYGKLPDDSQRKKMIKLIAQY